jgi:para-aminobenzoate synthetase component 1
MSTSPLPLIQAVDVSDALSGIRAIAHLPHAFTLHSGLLDDRSRWTFFGADPFAVYRGDDLDGAFARYRELATRVRREDRPAGVVPFSGGAVGYWSYDFGRRFEQLPSIARDDLGLPDFVIAFYDVIGVHDHVSRSTWLFSSGLPFDDERRAVHARERLEQFQDLLWKSARRAPRRPAPCPRIARSTFAPDDFRRAVVTIKDHIASGDIFQANLSQRWTVPLEAGEPGFALDLFQALVDRSPAPFSAYLDCGDHTVVSGSPERFLELRGRRIETRPIKGTRPRSADPVQDRRLREELLKSPKDRAENVMIVDVLRNDLGRVCETGSVETRALCELETFPQVFHLTSTVTGTLRRDYDAFDLLKASFPGGSITGAPKIRAMEILDALEPVRRHVYTGAIGYLDWSGSADWNIAIRTALVTPDAVHFAAGGGITIDSDPDEELAETLHKAEGMRLALSEVLAPVELPSGAVHA